MARNRLYRGNFDSCAARYESTLCVCSTPTSAQRQLLHDLLLLLLQRRQLRHVEILVSVGAGLRSLGVHYGLANQQEAPYPSEA